MENAARVELLERRDVGDIERMGCGCINGGVGDEVGRGGANGELPAELDG